MIKTVRPLEELNIEKLILLLQKDGFHIGTRRTPDNYETIELSFERGFKFALFIYHDVKQIGFHHKMHLSGLDYLPERFAFLNAVNNVPHLLPVFSNRITDLLDCMYQFNIEAGVSILQIRKAAESFNRAIVQVAAFWRDEFQR